MKNEIRVKVEVDKIDIIKKVLDYFVDEVKEGKSEFRVVIMEDAKVIIHPLGKDGKTLDLDLSNRGSDA